MRKKRALSDLEDDNDAADSLSSISDYDSDGEPDVEEAGAFLSEVEGSLVVSQDDEEEVPSWIRYMPRPPWAARSSTTSITYQPSGKRIKVDPEIVKTTELSSCGINNSTPSTNFCQSGEVVMSEEGAVEGVGSRVQGPARKMRNKYRCNVNETAFLLEMLGNVK